MAGIDGRDSSKGTHKTNSIDYYIKTITRKLLSFIASVHSLSESVRRHWANERLHGVQPLDLRSKVWTQMFELKCLSEWQCSVAKSVCRMAIAQW